MANDLNRCEFIGRAGSDPESRQAGQTSVCNFSIAVGESWTKDGQKQERTEWVRCTAFGKLGEICQNYITKGKQVFVAGNLKTEKYTDKQGVEKYSTSIVLNDMQLLGGRDDAAGGQRAANTAPQQAAPAPSGGSAGFDDDIPFAPYMNNTSAKPNRSNMTHYRSRKDKHQQPTGDDFNTTHGKRHKERIFARSLGMTRKAYLKKQTLKSRGNAAATNHST